MTALNFTHTPQTQPRLPFALVVHRFHLPTTRCTVVTPHSLKSSPSSFILCPFSLMARDTSGETLCQNITQTLKKPRTHTHTHTHIIIINNRHTHTHGDTTRRIRQPDRRTPPKTTALFQLVFSSIIMSHPHAPYFSSGELRVSTTQNTASQTPLHNRKEQRKKPQPQNTKNTRRETVRPRMMLYSACEARGGRKEGKRALVRHASGVGPHCALPQRSRAAALCVVVRAD